MQSGTLSNRLWGTAQAFGGALEAAAGIGCGAATAWTGAGALAGSAVALHGADNVLTGLEEAWTGEQKQTFTAKGLTVLSGSKTFGEISDAGFGILGTMGVGAFSGVAKAEPLVDKTLQWTSKLFPGSGMTGAYGNMILSRLGTKLDRLQVMLHEKVHSFLSPAATSLFAQSRASLRSFLYQGSNLMRFAEEALAESYAQVASRSMSGLSFIKALKTGIKFPLENGYVSASELAAESAAAASKLADGERQIFRAK